MNGWDIPYNQQKDLAELTEKLYGFTDEEIGKLAKEYIRNMELTRGAADDSLKAGFRFLVSSDKQFGKKAGKHAYDYGLDPSSETDRGLYRILQIMRQNKE